jgi:nitrogen fixation protein NifU and related proteins
MATLDALYQDLILDHNRKPRNYRSMENANRRAEGNNPLCGDRLTVWLLMDGETIQDVSFEGAGCAISRASASLMTTAIAGKTREEAQVLFEKFHRLVTGNLPPGKTDDLGKLMAFKGVSAYPVRVKCASLAWHALKAAMEQPNAVVSTE